MEDIVKKKRGRKPKIDPSKVNISEDIITNVILDPIVLVTDIIKKNKRGRKPKFVYSTQDISPIQQSSLSDDENIIVRLNININDNIIDNINDNTNNINNNNIDNNKLNEYGDEHPYAYNRDEYYNMSNIDDTEIINEKITEITHNNSGLKIVNLLKDFEEKNKVNEWPTNTSIHCYWCCHKFDNPPFGIPVNFIKNNFDVFGCFCSLECAATYNFKMHDNIDEMWERYNLINLLYRRTNIGKIVKPAPDRLSLKIFGGYLDIEEFRSFFKSNKLINVNFPPMTSLTQQIEEINDYELNNDYKYIPIDQERIDKYKEKILFKRNKPLFNNKNSLEYTMNLKYN